MEAKQCLIYFKTSSFNSLIHAVQCCYVCEGGRGSVDAGEAIRPNGFPVVSLPNNLER